MGKECWQLTHPSWQTDCFEMAGGEPCSSLDCTVEEALIKDVILKITRDPEYIESLIRCRLFHRVCRMSRFSPDNDEFWQRVGEDAFD